LLEGLEVDRNRMRLNLQISGGQIYSEAVMLALAAKLGKQSAHRLVHRIAGEAVRRKQSFQQAIAEDPGVSARLSAAEINRLFDADMQTAQCGALVDRILGGAE
jgi:adenylosuccinate lyase